MPSTIDVLDAEETLQTVMTLDGLDARQSGTPLIIQRSGSLGITTAGVWSKVAQYTVPANYLFRPIVAHSSVTTAGSRTLIGAGRRLGSFDVSSNVFTADYSLIGPHFYPRCFALVTTALSAVATNVTLTYNDQDGAPSTSSALTIPASAPVGNLYEFTLATGDIGVRAVTAVADTAAPTGVIEIWGIFPILDTLGVANDCLRVDLGGRMQFAESDSIFILFNAAAITAQVRTAAIEGILCDA